MDKTGERYRGEEAVTDIGRTVGILDAGAQYGYDIEQEIKRAGFHAVRLPFDMPAHELNGYGAIILSGGPKSVYDKDAPKCDPAIFDLPVPKLGLCYGMQLINHHYGGEVKSLPDGEYGPTKVRLNDTSLIFDGLYGDKDMVMSHGDSVTKIAPGFHEIAFTDNITAGIASEDGRTIGIQFHPEVSGYGDKIFRNFLHNIAGLEGDYEYTLEDMERDMIAEIQTEVGGKQVLAFISGGVDSSTLGALLRKALPVEQTSLVFVDTGLMRMGETAEVTKYLEAAGINVIVRDASGEMLHSTTVIEGIGTPPLREVSDPEVKRKIIGDTFIQIQRKMAKELGLNLDTYVLAQGTLHTDLIESGSLVASKQADTIKSHHNDSPLARALRAEGRVLEPLRHLQKTDVRRLAEHLGLPNEIVDRQPFPGPGLAVRILCANQPYLDRFDEISQQLSSIASNTYHPILLPVRTVGVQGDRRTYSHLAALSGKQNWPELIKLAREIPTAIRGVNRVVYVFGEPVTERQTKITPTFINEDTLGQLKAADHIVSDVLKKYGLHTSISQVPVVLFPVDFGKPGFRSIGLRPFMTTDYKVGDIAIPGKDFPIGALKEIVDGLLGNVPGISRVVYDLTPKPPATIEWE